MSIALEARVRRLEKLILPPNHHAFILLSEQELSAEQLASIRPTDSIFIKRIVLTHDED